MKRHYTGAPIDGKKALLLCILQILLDQSDENHPLTSGMIIDALRDEYGLQANRNTIGRSLQMLQMLGYEISLYEDNHRGAYIEERAFEDMELRWLIDGVLNSKYMTENYAARLIDKLKRQANHHFRSSMDHVTALRDLPHQNSPVFSLNMELLDEALENSRRVCFCYNRMDADSQLHPLEKRYCVLPVGMFCVSSKYYLVAREPDKEMLLHFRVDRITDIASEDAVHPEDVNTLKRQPFDPVRYAMEHPHMYGGEVERVVMRMPRWLAGAVLDAFGKAAEMRPLDDTMMEVRVRAAVEGMRFFALQYGVHCEVMEPKKLRNQVKDDLKTMMERYGD